MFDFIHCCDHGSDWSKFNDLDKRVKTFSNMVYLTWFLENWNYPCNQCFIVWHFVKAVYTLHVRQQKHRSNTIQDHDTVNEIRILPVVQAVNYNQPQQHIQGIKRGRKTAQLIVCVIFWISITLFIIHLFTTSEDCGFKERSWTYHLSCMC